MESELDLVLGTVGWISVVPGVLVFFPMAPQRAAAHLLFWVFAYRPAGRALALESPGGDSVPCVLSLAP